MEAESDPPHSQPRRMPYKLTVSTASIPTREKAEEGVREAIASTDTGPLSLLWSIAAS
jgi:hypothetical protein